MRINRMEAKRGQSRWELLKGTQERDKGLGGGGRCGVGERWRVRDDLEVRDHRKVMYCCSALWSKVNPTFKVLALTGVLG